MTTALRRAIGPVGLICYGVGGMLGAGIYSLIGDTAELMGNAMWLGFAVAMLAALFTALSYANLGSRYPRAAGASYVALRAYRLRFLAYVVGLTVAASGLTSMATGSRALAGFVIHLGLQWPAYVIAPLYLAVLASIVFWGIRQSVFLNVICTLIETGGLIFIIVVGARYWGSVDYLTTPHGPLTFSADLTSITLATAGLAFFAFIGFEDVLNVAEECKNPQVVLPIALCSAITIAATIYILVAITAVSVVPAASLGKNALADVAKTAAPWLHPKTLTIVSIFAVANTGLLNYVMGTRLLYGMAAQGLMPRPLTRLNPYTRTPWVAVLVLLAIVLAILAPALLAEQHGGGNAVRPLASATTLLLLSVFAVINVALVILKLRKDEPRGRFEVPIFVPIAGAIVCLILVGKDLYESDKDFGRLPEIIAGTLVAGIALLYLVLRPSTVVIDD